MKEVVSETTTDLIRRILRPTLAPEGKLGGLRYMMRDMRRLPFVARDTKGRRELAQTATAIKDTLFPDGEVLSSNDMKPVIFRRNRAGGASDVGPKYAGERGTVFDRFVQKVIDPYRSLTTGIQEV